MDNRELIRYEMDGASFDLPASWTVREMMRYDSAVMLERAGVSLYERLWAGVVLMAQNWRADFDLRVNLDEITDKRMFEVVKWAAMVNWSAWQRVQADELPKNS